MQNYKILGPSDIGKGILVEYDAGYVSPVEFSNDRIIKESFEAGDHSKPLEFYAVLQKYNTPNRNGRVYPERVLKRESENYIRNYIKKNTALSELNHPESSLIDLDRVSHIITDIWWDKNVLVGKLKLLTSPGFHERGIVSTKGDQAANLLRLGVTLGISSRGVGSLKKVGEQNEVQDDFELICFDLVQAPSTPGAYLFKEKNDQYKFEENLQEEKELKAQQSSSKSLDLMNKLSDYLGK